MSQHLTRQIVADKATIIQQLPVVPEADRSFNLPSGLYVATAAMYFGFVGIMAAGFSSPGLLIPLTICGIFFTAFFGIGALFVRTDPCAKAKILRWSELRSKGIQTHTGRLSMKDAVVQMMILPILIVIWGLVTVTIAALV
ncbi:hypothetical protein GCM10023115_21860 [Pontixanthobacter gangjinensis]|uniref:Uncharacterized protein n=1 Tax=Pontixanthobacter gangjinensis TaxID=1028742 RepID=A0A6I4SSD4_9SPHN|nr:hypothetical protein [Pontixanthobacter gangjinensis]MXO57432.1 hypothetical protein [Pontixanthobacter gangjinensis]